MSETLDNACIFNDHTVAPLALALYGHPDAGGYLEKWREKAVLERGLTRHQRAALRILGREEESVAHRVRR